MTTQTKPKRTRRRVTVENSHEMHCNPHTDVNLIMEWAKVHRLLCKKCANRKTRKPHRAPYPDVWGENYNYTDGEE